MRSIRMPLLLVIGSVFLALNLVSSASAQDLPDVAPITAVLSGRSISALPDADTSSAFAANYPVVGQREPSYRNQDAFRAWRRSLIPLVASQSLDIASSYGMRELNPVLAGSDGRFGVRGLAVKSSVVAGVAGLEYLLVKKWPRSARVLSKLNWSSAIVTSSFAVHNFAIR